MKKNLVLFLLVGLCALGLDRFTKVWALEFLQENAPVHWLWSHFLGLQLTFNYGASFSFAENATWLFSIIGVLAVCAIPFLINKSLLWTFFLALVWGGALGNLADRLFSGEFGRGAVTDFIVYSTWFTGNVADIFLVFGAGGLVVILLTGAGEFDKKAGSRE